MSSSCTTVENGAKLLVAVKIGLFYIKIRMCACDREIGPLKFYSIFPNIWKKSRVLIRFYNIL